MVIFQVRQFLLRMSAAMPLVHGGTHDQFTARCGEALESHWFSSIEPTSTTNFFRLSWVKFGFQFMENQDASRTLMMSPPLERKSPITNAQSEYCFHH